MYSSKNVILVSAIGATACSFLSPIMARIGGYVGFIILKVIQGMLQVKYKALYQSHFVDGISTTVVKKNDLTPKGILIYQTFDLDPPLKKPHNQSNKLTFIFQGPIIPALTVMISCWIPPKERSFGTTLIYSGQQLGSVISFSLSGYLAEQFGNLNSNFSNLSIYSFLLSLLIKSTDFVCTR